MAGNTSSIFSVDVGLRLAQQIAVLRLGLPGTHPALKRNQRRDRSDGSKREGPAPSTTPYSSHRIRCKLWLQCLRSLPPRNQSNQN